MTVQQKILHRIGEAGGRLRVKSALNPALWMCAIVTIPLVCLITKLENSPTWLIVITAAPVICAIFGFVFLLFFDRDKLQSEDYQIRKKSLELIQEKGYKFPIVAPSIQDIANPDIPKLSTDNEEVDR